MRLAEAITDFSHLKTRLPGQNDPWLQQLRYTALQDLARFGLPTLTTETWKYTRLNTLLQQDFCLAIAPNSRLTIADYVVTDGIVLVFVDGYFAPTLSYNHHQPQVISSNLLTALSTHKDLVHQYVGHCAPTGSVGFTALNAAFMQEGAVIHIPAKEKILDPIQLLFIQSGQAQTASHLRNLIVLDNCSEATVIESYVSRAPDNVYFTNAVTEIVLKQGAQLHYGKQQHESMAGFHIHYAGIHQARDSHLTSYNFDFGGKLVRNCLQTNLEGPDARCNLWGLYVTCNNQHTDNHTRINHHAPHTISRQHYKGILSDNSHAVFNGKVVIAPRAQKTDAQQCNQNLLLSSAAEIDTKPELEIYANDVKCSHGATISDLDPDALFYLCSRGIPTAAAQAILLAGFMQEIILKVPVLKLRQKLQNLVENISLS